MDNFIEIFTLTFYEKRHFLNALIPAYIRSGPHFDCQFPWEHPAGRYQFPENW